MRTNHVTFRTPGDAANSFARRRWLGGRAFLLATCASTLGPPWVIGGMSHLMRVVSGKARKGREGKGYEARGQTGAGHLCLVYAPRNGVCFPSFKICCGDDGGSCLFSGVSPFHFQLSCDEFYRPWAEMSRKIELTEREKWRKISCQVDVSEAFADLQVAEPERIGRQN